MDNLVSQAKKVNLSEFKKIENKRAEALKPPPQEVTVDIKINYDGPLTRPPLVSMLIIQLMENLFLK